MNHIMRNFGLLFFLSIACIPQALFGAESEKERNEIAALKENIKNILFSSIKQDNEKKGDIEKILNEYAQKYPIAETFIEGIRDKALSAISSAPNITMQLLNEEKQRLGTYIQKIKDAIFARYKKRMYPELLLSLIYDIILFMKEQEKTQAYSRLQEQQRRREEQEEPQRKMQKQQMDEEQWNKKIKDMEAERVRKMEDEARWQEKRIREAYDAI